VAPLRLQVRETEEARGSTIRLEWAPVAATPLPGLDDDLSRERQLDALAVVLADSGWEASAFACVALLSGDLTVRATPDQVERLRAVRQHVASPGKCPETYDTGWAEWNEDGTPRVRPPGAGPDPYLVAVTHVVAWAEDWTVVGLQVRRSAGTEILRCEQQKVDGTWSTACGTTARWVF
jgi:hypothetical protein